MPWLRLWTDILDDPDIDAIDDESGAGQAYYKLLAVAKRHNQNGLLPVGHRLYTWMRRPKEKVDRWIAELIAASLIDETERGLEMHGWARWQEPKDRTNAKRQAEYRARHPKPKRNAVTHLNSEEEEKETEGEQKIVTQTLRDRYVTPHNGVTQPLLAVTEAPPHADSRTPEDQKHFDEAVSILSRSLQTQTLSIELNRRSDLPEVIAIKGWKWLVAARVFGEGRAKKLTYSYLLGIARNATRDEFEDHGREPVRAGHRKPEPEPVFHKATPNWKGPKPA